MRLELRRRWAKSSLAERSDIIRDAIDLFGEELLGRLETERATAELKELTRLLEWLHKRVMWMACLPSTRIDRYIRRNYYRNHRLPEAFRFEKYVAEAIENFRIWKAINSIL